MNKKSVIKIGLLATSASAILYGIGAFRKMYRHVKKEKTGEAYRNYEQQYVNEAIRKKVDKKSGDN